MSSIEGMDTLLAQLEGLKGEILQAAIRGLRKGLQRTVKVAKALSPYDTGDNRNRIEAHAELNGDVIDADVTASSDHAVYLEMGTGPVGAASGGNGSSAPVTYSPKGWTYRDPETGQFVHTKGQPAKPYMYPAYKQTKAAVISDVADEINKGGP